MGTGLKRHEFGLTAAWNRRGTLGTGRRILGERDPDAWVLKETGDQLLRIVLSTAAEARTFSSCRHHNRLELGMWATCSPTTGDSVRKSSYPALVHQDGLGTCA